ncbi:hypothetical protein A2X44_04525 [candidate division CPR3 bacterium GWF2_35_18]|uniref:AAA ATPase containing von Willebrand factor type A (VWA) protein-like protein omain n=1 Tax=candidate division CPR3 bacterium GW2011_GWF2_35_18 TaxID=1618350 RepID=A0A0G0BIX7_UNCC3|nr:MAG: AAA ATPase containing von Willebrand factor type A (VWA) protein-like protein omain [candidate division CPR3 bacterium GW2011_GWF2_35_18]OGB62617.1 MAG: hypothetical protein A2X44_04525 [candidate division CPR3 bacterium GWF2_35_18]OGB78843.1 MAG: hypothetical protein A2296_05285 [candidate division CPR3 bacterium RIFOXYB2_FULL_35_8]
MKSLLLKIAIPVIVVGGIVGGSLVTGYPQKVIFQLPEGKSTSLTENLAKVKEAQSTLSAVPSPEPSQNNFRTNGDYINNWYWLRDRSVEDYASWVLENVSKDKSGITLEMEVLATNTYSGGAGYDATFRLFYGIPANQENIGTLQTMDVTLDNVSTATDPVGYTCKGTVTIPTSVLGEYDDLYLKVERIASVNNHVAFNAQSIKSFTSGDYTEETDNEDDTTSDDQNNDTGEEINDTDTDSDGLTDVQEDFYGTLVDNSNSDNDNIEDGLDISPLINPTEPTLLDNQKVGMVRIEQSIKAYGLDGWVDKYNKEYGLFKSWLEHEYYSDTDGTKASTMDEDHYELALNKVFAEDKFITYKLINITPSAIGVADTEATHDFLSERQYTYSASFLHQNEYRFQYDYLTDYYNAFLKNSEEIKYPSADNYFRYLLYPIIVKSGKEQTVTIQFKDEQVYTDMQYTDDNHYKLPAMIFSLYDSNNFNDDDNKVLYEGVAVVKIDDINLFEISLTIPEEEAVNKVHYIKVTPTWIEKNGYQVSYKPLVLNWDIIGLTRDIIYQKDTQGNSKILTEELKGFDDLNAQPKDLGFFTTNEDSTNMTEQTTNAGIVKKDPNNTEGKQYTVLDTTVQVSNYVDKTYGAINNIYGLVENMVTSSNKVNDLNELPSSHWARSTRYAGPLAVFTAIQGIASMATNGQQAWIAYKSGNYVDVTYYSAKTVIAGTQTTANLVKISENTVGYAGKAGKLAKLTSKKAGVGIAVAIGVVEVAYDSYKLANTNDPILKTAYTEKIVSDTLDTGISIAAVFSPHTLVFQITWSVEAELYGLVFGEDFAYKVAQSPGKAIVFLAEYFFTGGIPSQMSQAAYDDARTAIIDYLEVENVVRLPYMSLFVDPDL